MAFVLSGSKQGAASAALSAHRLLMRIAASIGNTFAWVFVFAFFASFLPIGAALSHAGFLYALASAIGALATPAMMRLMRGGMRRGIVYGLLCFAAALVALGAAIDRADSIGLFILFALLLGLFRATYRAPYAVERAVLGGSRATPAAELLLALIPLLCGWWLSLSAPAGATAAALLFTAAAIAFAALLPLPGVPEVYERFSWGYRETFAELFQRRHRTPLVVAICRGIEVAALFLVWPIAVFLIVQGSYLLLGAVFCLTLLATAAGRVLMRHFLSFIGLESSTPVAVTLAATGWLIRPFVATPFAVVAVDTYTHSSSERFDIASREVSADGGTYLDEFTALKEMGTAIGGLCFAFVVAALATIIPITAVFVFAFIVAACAAGLSVALARDAKRFL